MKSPRFSGRLKSSPILIRRVQGHSMVPALPPGTIIWATPWFRSIKSGDVVIIVHNNREKIKRIEKLDGNRMFVLGDHPLVSTDSRHFGWLERDVVIAKLIWPRPSR